MIAELSFEHLVGTVKAGADYVSNLPLTDEQLEKGKEVLRQFERSRQNRMLEAPNINGDSKT
jgi:hypothetical protein